MSSDRIGRRLGRTIMGQEVVELEVEGGRIFIVQGMTGELSTCVLPEVLNCDVKIRPVKAPTNYGGDQE